MPSSKKTKPILSAVVLSATALSRSVIRVVLHEGDLSAFTPHKMTDSYVKLLFPEPRMSMTGIGDLSAIPAAARPRRRAYTVRDWDAQGGRLTLDIVTHGATGLGGTWAQQAQPGDVVYLAGPGGDWEPWADADWHLLAGDLSAMPAIAVGLPRLPAGRWARVFIEVEHPADEIPLEAPDGVGVTWLHRNVANSEPIGQPLIKAITALTRPHGSGTAFIHGEAGMVRTIRKLLRTEWAVPTERLSASGYWRVGANDEDWRASKARWLELVETDEQGSAR
ncbi:MAG: siderophore-interacting protein [Actinomycetota bacterium]